MEEVLDIDRIIGGRGFLPSSSDDEEEVAQIAKVKASLGWVWVHLTSHSFFCWGENSLSFIRYNTCYNEAFPDPVLLLFSQKIRPPIRAHQVAKVQP